MHDAHELLGAVLSVALGIALLLAEVFATAGKNSHVVTVVEVSGLSPNLGFRREKTVKVRGRVKLVNQHVLLPVEEQPMTGEKMKYHRAATSFLSSFYPIFDCLVRCVQLPEGWVLQKRYVCIEEAELVE